MDGDDGGAVWTDRCCLQQVQYGTEANLAARQVVTAARDAAARADWSGYLADADGSEVVRAEDGPDASSQRYISGHTSSVSPWPAPVRTVSSAPGI